MLTYIDHDKYKVKHFLKSQISLETQYLKIKANAFLSQFSELCNVQICPGP